MKNPAGTECMYFYGDYYRGRDLEECRLLCSSWSRDLCRKCPVPSIARTNACEYMVLRAEVSRKMAVALQRRVRVKVYCQKTERSGFDPHIGCGECHPLPLIFDEKK